MTKEQLDAIRARAAELGTCMAETTLLLAEVERLTAERDAALREARAQEAGAKVEAPVVWETDAFGLDYCKQGDKLLQAVKCADDDRWAWGVRVEGYADTEAEAKSAAIAAARGMK